MEFNEPNFLNLNDYLARNFETFKEQFSIYFDATKTDKNRKCFRLARLKNLSGSNGVMLYNSIKDDSVTESEEFVINTPEFRDPLIDDNIHTVETNEIIYSR